MVALCLLSVHMREHVLVGLPVGVVHFCCSAGIGKGAWWQKGGTAIVDHCDYSI